MAFRSTIVGNPTNTNTSSVSPGSPAGLQATDMQIAEVMGGYGANTEGTPPAGWTQIGSTLVLAATRYSVYWAPGTAAAGTWVNNTGSANFSVRITAFSGRVLSAPTAFGSFNLNNSFPTVPAASVTATAGDDLFIAYAGDVFTGLNAALTSRDTTANNGNSILATADAISAGATPAYTVNEPNGFKNDQSWTIALPALAPSSYYLSDIIEM